MNGEKKRQMASGVFIMPIKWREINPHEARACTFVALCSDGKNRTAVCYLKKPPDQLSDAQAAEIIMIARAMGLDSDTLIYGLIENKKYNKSGAKFIKKQEG